MPFKRVFLQTKHPQTCCPQRKLCSPADSLRSRNRRSRHPPFITPTPPTRHHTHEICQTRKHWNCYQKTETAINLGWRKLKLLSIWAGFGDLYHPFTCISPLRGCRVPETAIIKLKLLSIWAGFGERKLKLLFFGYFRLFSRKWAELPKNKSHFQNPRKILV